MFDWINWFTMYVRGYDLRYAWLASGLYLFLVLSGYKIAQSLVPTSILSLKE